MDNKIKQIPVHVDQNKQTITFEAKTKEGKKVPVSIYLANGENNKTFDAADTIYGYDKEFDTTTQNFIKSLKGKTLEQVQEEIKNAKEDAYQGEETLGDLVDYTNREKKGEKIFAKYKTLETQETNIKLLLQQEKQQHYLHQQISMMQQFGQMPYSMFSQNYTNPYAMFDQNYMNPFGIFDQMNPYTMFGQNYMSNGYSFMNNYSPMNMFTSMNMYNPMMMYNQNYSYNPSFTGAYTVPFEPSEKLKNLISNLIAEYEKHIKEVEEYLNSLKQNEKYTFVLGEITQKKPQTNATVTPVISEPASEAENDNTGNNANPFANPIQSSSTSGTTAPTTEQVQNAPKNTEGKSQEGQGTAAPNTTETVEPSTTPTVSFTGTNNPSSTITVNVGLQNGESAKIKNNGDTIDVNINGNATQTQTAEQAEQTTTSTEQKTEEGQKGNETTSQPAIIITPGTQSQEQANEQKEQPQIFRNKAGLLYNITALEKQALSVTDDEKDPLHVEILKVKKHIESFAHRDLNDSELQTQQKRLEDLQIRINERAAALASPPTKEPNPAIEPKKEALLNKVKQAMAEYTELNPDAGDDDITLQNLQKNIFDKILEENESLLTEAGIKDYEARIQNVLNAAKERIAQETAKRRAQEQIQYFQDKYGHTLDPKLVEEYRTAQYNSEINYNDENEKKELEVGEKLSRLETTLSSNSSGDNNNVTVNEPMTEQGGPIVVAKDNFDVTPTQEDINALKEEAEAANAKAEATAKDRTEAEAAKANAEAEAAKAKADAKEAIDKAEAAERARAEAEAAKNKAEDEAKKAKADAQAAINKAEAAERARAEAEAAKNKAEDETKKAKDDEQAAITKAEAAERARTEAEAAKNKAEADAAKAKADAQAAINKAEAAAKDRTEAEAAKANAEADAAKAKADAQAAINKAEAAERARAEAEAAKNKAEDETKKAKDDEQAAITKAEAAEKDRAEAEAAKDKAENEAKKAIAEVLAANAKAEAAEKDRTEAEAAKANAEADAAKAKADAQAAINKAEAAERARAEAEAAKNKAEDETKKAKDEAQSAMSKSEAAEKDRAEAEAAKDKAEADAAKAKADAEAANAKAKAAEKARTEAEAAKAQAQEKYEKAIADAETANTKAETDTKAKADAEDAKNKALQEYEKAKAEAEAAMTKAEAAEKAREEAEAEKTQAEAKAAKAKAEAEAAKARAEEEAAKAKAEAAMKIKEEISEERVNELYDTLSTGIELNNSINKGARILPPNSPTRQKIQKNNELILTTLQAYEPNTIIAMLADEEKGKTILSNLMKHNNTEALGFIDATLKSEDQKVTIIRNTQGKVSLAANNNLATKNAEKVHLLSLSNEDLANIHKTETMFNNLGTPLLSMFNDNKTIPRYQTTAKTQLEKIELSILEQQDLTEIKKIEANRLDLKAKATDENINKARIKAYNFAKTSDADLIKAIQEQLTDEEIIFALTDTLMIRQIVRSVWNTPDPQASFDAIYDKLYSISDKYGVEQNNYVALADKHAEVLNEIALKILNSKDEKYINE